MTTSHLSINFRRLAKPKRGAPRSNRGFAEGKHATPLKRIVLAKVVFTHHRRRAANMLEETEVLRKQLKKTVSTVDVLKVKLLNLVEEVTALRSQLPETLTTMHDPLAAAKARGASYTKAEWQRPENLTLADAAHYSQRSDRMINAARNKGNLYALLLEGNLRGFRYPQWQFDADPVRLAQVLHALPTDGQVSCWSKHQFLTRPNSMLDGRAPSEVILDSTADIAHLVQIVHNRYTSEQGAA